MCFRADSYLPLIRASKNDRRLIQPLPTSSKGKKHQQTEKKIATEQETKLDHRHRATEAELEESRTRLVARIEQASNKNRTVNAEAIENPHVRSEL
jgi:hypothetical protein